MKHRARRGHRPLRLLLGLPLALVTAAPPSVAAPGSNIVVIVADDLSERMLDDLLAADLMPHFRSLFVNAGIRFTNSFVTTPLCCPSRATLLTGQYAHNHGVRSNDLPKGGVTLLNDASTLATWLANAGYHTGLVGKYLNGYGKDASHTVATDDPTYVPAGWTDWQALLDPSLTRVYNYEMNDNGVVRRFGAQPEDYQTDVLAQRAVDFLTELPGPPPRIDVPFLLWVSPPAPHSESIPEPCALPDQEIGIIRPAPRHLGVAAAISLPRPPSFNEVDLTDKSTWLQAAFPTRYDQAAVDCLEQSYRSRLESMVAVDDLIGAVTDTLLARNALDDTVLIFTSDNGFAFGEHRFTGKVVPYEESARVPLFIRLPQMTSSSSTAALVLNTDLAPTIAELAGVTPGLVVDGRSLVPFLLGTPPPVWRDLFLLEGLQTAQKGPIVPAYSALRSGPHAPSPNRLMMSWADGSGEYYDLDLDPDELGNTIGQVPPSSVRWARTRGLELKACAGQTCRNLETF